MSIASKSSTRKHQSQTKQDNNDRRVGILPATTPSILPATNPSRMPATTPSILPATAPSILPATAPSRMPTPQDLSQQSISTLPSSRPSPLWLLRLSAWQRPSSAVVFLLIAAMLALYSWTVYSQKMWNQVYKSLKILQLHERELTTTSEVLKNQMALQAEQDATALVPVNPSAAIFLQSTPASPAYVTAGSIATPKPTLQTLQITPGPLGY